MKVLKLAGRGWFEILACMWGNGICGCCGCVCGCDGEGEEEEEDEVEDDCVCWGGGNVCLNVIEFPLLLIWIRILCCIWCIAWANDNKGGGCPTPANTPYMGGVKLLLKFGEGEEEEGVVFAGGAVVVGGSSSSINSDWHRGQRGSPSGEVCVGIKSAALQPWQ